MKCKKEEFVKGAIFHFYNKTPQGKLLQDRLQDKRITYDSYLILLCKYIHNNPLKAGLVENLENWVYSNYLEYLGKRQGMLYSKLLLETYPDDFENYSLKIEEYQKYVDEKAFTDLLIDYE